MHNLLLETSDLATVESHLEWVVTQDPGLIEWRVTLAGLVLESGHPERVASLVKPVLALNVGAYVPGLDIGGLIRESYLLLIDASNGQQREVEMDSLYREAMARLPRNEDIVLYYYDFLTSWKGVDAANTFLIEVVKTHPDFADCWYQLGMAYIDANRPYLAREAMIKGLGGRNPFAVFETLIGLEHFLRPNLVFQTEWREEDREYSESGLYRSFFLADYQLNDYFILTGTLSWNYLRENLENPDKTHDIRITQLLEGRLEMTAKITPDSYLTGHFSGTGEEFTGWGSALEIVWPGEEETWQFSAGWEETPVSFRDIVRRQETSVSAELESDPWTLSLAGFYYRTPDDEVIVSEPLDIAPEYDIWVLRRKTNEGYSGHLTWKYRLLDDPMLKTGIYLNGRGFRFTSRDYNSPDRSWAIGTLFTATIHIGGGFEFSPTMVIGFNNEARNDWVWSGSLAYHLPGWTPGISFEWNPNSLDPYWSIGFFINDWKY